MTRQTFSERAVIVTGASSGLGRALALRLADEGAWVALAARREDRLEQVALECRQRGGRALPVVTDVRDEQACRQLVERSLEEFGRLDMLINNAGLSVVSHLESLPDLTLFRRVMDVNFYGALHCTFHALPALEQHQGRLVNISSLGGILPIPFNTSYIASKHALMGFSDALRMEIASQGVSVTVVCPSWVITEFHENYLDRDGRPKGPSGRAIYTKRTMSADRCAQITLEAARRRRRELVMTPGNLGRWSRLIAPALTDRLILQLFLWPMLRRARRAAG